MSKNAFALAKIFLFGIFLFPLFLGNANTANAQTFTLTPSEGSAIITKPSYGATMVEGSLAFRGTGSDDTILTLFNENAENIGTATISNGEWNIVPTTEFAEGDHTVCLDGGSCIAFTVIPPISPGGISGNTLWIKSDKGNGFFADGYEASAWVNFGTEGDVLNAAEGQKPIFSASLPINFNPVLQFDGVDDFFSGTSNYGISGENAFTAFVAAKSNASNGNFAFFGGSTAVANAPFFKKNSNNKNAIGIFSGNFLEGSKILAENVPFVAGVSKTASNIFQLFLDGGNDGNSGEISGFSGFASTFLRIGKHATENFSGDISEIVIFNRELSALERQKINSYFAIKYGTTLSQDIPTDYILSDEAKIWDANANIFFRFDIFGIATDSGSDFAQKISTSANQDSILTISTINNFVLPNSHSSRTSLTEKSAVLLGNNDGAAVWTEEDAPDSFEILERKWKADVSGSVGEIFLEWNTENLLFDVPNLLYGTEYYMILDTDKDGIFADEEPIPLVSAGGGKWTHQILLQKNDIFTIATEILDIIPPQIPVLEKLGNDISAPFLSNALTPNFSGTGEKKTSVEVKNSAGDLLCSAVVDSTKKWSCTSSISLLEGENSVKITQKDKAQNVSPELSVDFVLDFSAPQIPQIISVDTDVSAPYTVKRNNSVFLGTGEIGAMVSVKKSTGETICTSEVWEDGEWFCSATGLSDGVHEIHIFQTDGAENFSENLVIFVGVDTNAPSPPAVTGVSTVDNFSVISGTGEVGATILIQEEGQTICWARVEEDGNWSCNTTPQNDYEFEIVQQDSAGNLSTATPLVKDTTPPLRPSLSGESTNNQTFFEFYTNTKNPTIIGLGEANSTIQLKKVLDDSLVCSVMISAGGNWSCFVLSPMEEGVNHLKMVQTDTANNISPDAFLDVIVDTTPPEIPVLTQFGESLHIPFVGNASAKLQGTGEIAATLVVKKQETLVCSATVQPDGKWECLSAFAFASGIQNFSISQKDKVNNVSPVLEISATVDADAPLSPILSQVLDDTEKPFVSSTQTPNIFGTGEIGAKILVKKNATELCTATVQSDGKWSCSAIALANGSNTVSITQTDTVKNISPTTTEEIVVSLPSSGGGGGGSVSPSQSPSATPSPTPTPEEEHAAPNEAEEPEEPLTEEEIEEEVLELEKGIEEKLPPEYYKISTPGGKRSFLVLYYMLHGKPLPKLKFSDEGCVYQKSQLFFENAGNGISQNFLDLKKHFKSYSAVVFLTEVGLLHGEKISEKTEGTDEKIFLKKSINRAEFAKMVSIARQDSVFVGENCTYSTKLFPDIPAKEWFSPFVSNLLEKGIVHGYPDGKFLPEKNLKLAEVYKILALSFGYITEEEAEKKAKENRQEWFFPYKNALKKANKIPESLKSSSPEKIMKREDVFLFLEKMLK